ncbi:MAG: hypothetical protein U0Z44_07460 [Kouleothrix sp.]
MPRILITTSLRYLLRHLWQIGLAILGVALGVAVVVSIDLTNSSARRAFAISTETIAGRATHQIIGGPNGIDDALYRTLRVDLGLRATAPIVEGYASAPAQPGLTLHIFGVDPLAGRRSGLARQRPRRRTPSCLRCSPRLRRGALVGRYRARLRLERPAIHSDPDQRTHHHRHAGGAARAARRSRFRHRAIRQPAAGRHLDRAKVARHGRQTQPDRPDSARLAPLRRPCSTRSRQCCRPGVHMTRPALRTRRSSR